MYKVTTIIYVVSYSVHNSIYFHNIIPGNVPTLNELLLIKFSDGNTLRIIEVVAPIWQRIALSLGFDEARIKSIEKGCLYQPEDATIEMFGLWLEDNRDLKPATWSTLIQSLKNVNLTEIAVKLSNLQLVCLKFPAF